MNTSKLKHLAHLIWETLYKFSPRQQMRNPMLIVVMMGVIVTTILIIVDGLNGQSNQMAFNVLVALSLWLIVFFANLAETLAAHRGRAQIELLRKNYAHVVARRLVDDEETLVPVNTLHEGDIVICEAGDSIPSDGEVVEGIASVDESAITGESAPVIRANDSTRNIVIGGTTVLNGQIVVRVTAREGDIFLKRILFFLESTKRERMTYEIKFTNILSLFTLILLIVFIGLEIYVYFIDVDYAGTRITLPILFGLLASLMPTSLGGLISAMSISGVDWMLQHRILIKRANLVETAGRVDTLIFNKTGAITMGHRTAHLFIRADDVPMKRLVDGAQLASLADETPEGRSIVILAKEHFGLRGRDLSSCEALFIPFSTHTGISGIDLSATSTQPARRIRKGAADSIRKYLIEQGRDYSKNVNDNIDAIATSGGTPLVVIENDKVLGLIALRDMVRGGLHQRFSQLRAKGVQTIMVTHENATTAAAIAAQAGVDDFMAESNPKQKLDYIRTMQKQGHIVAVMGHGMLDAPSLAQADIGLANNTGTKIAREAGNMIDLDNDPTKLIETIEIGHQFLFTRQFLAHMNLATMVARYIAVVPALWALFAHISNENILNNLNVMALTSPQSAIISTMIFSVFFMVLLIPLVLCGVTQNHANGAIYLKYHRSIYLVASFLLPFVSIKLIDMTLNFLHIL